MNVTLLNTPAAPEEAPASRSHGMFFVGSGEGAGTAPEPSTCEPSKLAQNGPLPWIAAWTPRESSPATGSRKVNVPALLSAVAAYGPLPK